MALYRSKSIEVYIVMRHKAINLFTITTLVRFLEADSAFFGTKSPDDLSRSICRFDSIPVRFGYKRTHIYVFHLVTTIRIIGLGRINCTN